LLINLLFLINGFQILNEERRNSNLIKQFLYFSIYNTILSLLFIYIVYFIPSINNTILFIFKNIIEHLILLMHIIKAIKKKFMPLYSQYQLVKLLRMSRAILYKIKIIVYMKIIIFSLIYSISFILLSLIELFSSFTDYAEQFIYNYFINITLEIFLGLILAVLFFPFKVPIFFHFRIHYNNNEIILVNLDKENNNSNIKILTKNHLKKKYVKNKLPIVFINPFSNKNNIFDNLHIGMIENKINK
jgi:hypothetical protein